MSGNYQQAEDFTQEAFLQLFRKICFRFAMARIRIFNPGCTG